MIIAWKVLWQDEKGKRYRRFEDSEDQSPHTAIVFAKELKRRGLKPIIVCANKAWPPTQKQEEKRRPGDLWCPYCIKWRQFKLIAIKREHYTSEAFMRCPVCIISTNDFYVRKYNQLIEHISEADLVKKLSRG